MQKLFLSATASEIVHDDEKKLKGASIFSIKEIFEKYFFYKNLLWYSFLWKNSERTSINHLLTSLATWIALKSVILHSALWWCDHTWILPFDNDTSNVPFDTFNGLLLSESMQCEIIESLLEEWKKIFLWIFICSLRLVVKKSHRLFFFCITKIEWFCFQFIAVALLWKFNCPKWKKSSY